MKAKKPKYYAAQAERSATPNSLSVTTMNSLWPARTFDLYRVFYDTHLSEIDAGIIL